MTRAAALQTGALQNGGGAGAVPRHVAIIMDGNGRWAKKRFLPRFAGHKKGVEAAKAIVRAAGELGIEALTLYAFSSENWRRPADEISDLMGLLRQFIKNDIEELIQGGVRLRIIGDFHALQPDIVDMIESAMARTVNNSATTLVIALNYGAQAEILSATQALAKRAQAGELDPAAIDADLFEAQLETRDLPPLDLLIRTSGEVRLSNFLLWQAAYAELMFVDTLWPDFGPDNLVAAVNQYAGRERRYGGI